MTKISQAFIFAAGRGERMKPITDKTPKPLAKIAGSAILDHIIAKIYKIDSINNIIVNGHYLADQIEDHLRALNNTKLQFSHENEKLETGGGLVFAVNNDQFDIDKPLLLINGDILWQEKDEVNEIGNLFDFYQKDDCDIALGLKKSDDFFGYHGRGDFDLISGGVLSKDPQEEHAHSHVFAGLQIINPRILQSAPSKLFSMSYFYNNFSNLGINIKGLELKSDFFHIGDSKSLNKVQDLFIE